MSVNMDRTQETGKKSSTSHFMIGWILFLLCALCFIASSIKNRDILAFAGSIIFLIACIVFLLPLIQANRKAKRNKAEHDCRQPHNKPDARYGS